MDGGTAVFTSTQAHNGMEPRTKVCFDICCRHAEKIEVTVLAVCWTRLDSILTTSVLARRFRRAPTGKSVHSLSTGAPLIVTSLSNLPQYRTLQAPLSEMDNT